MLSPASILRLPYDPSLTLAGIEYAKKSLHYTYNRTHLSEAAWLRKIVAGVAYDLLGTTGFIEKDKCDLRMDTSVCSLR
jgi:hypothetical protein